MDWEAVEMDPTAGAAAWRCAPVSAILLDSYVKKYVSAA